MGVSVLVVGAAPRAGALLCAQLAALPVRTPLTIETMPDLAGLGHHPERTVVLAATLRVGDSTLLRLVDDPSLGVAALLSGTPGRHPVATQGSEVIALPAAVPDADFVGAVHLPAGVAAELAPVPSGDPLDGLLTLLVRSAAAGVPPVGIVSLDPLPGGRLDDGLDETVLDAAIATAEAAGVAERSGARPSDGFYSTFVLRRLSAGLTPWAVRHGVSATAVTLLAAVIGLGGAACFTIPGYAGLLLGAVLLQVCLVLDCVDGEVARITRTRSPFGAWLDSATDRIKEYAALAGLALAAAREGHQLWLVATAAMAVQTARHVQDQTFSKGVLASWQASLRDSRPLADRSGWQRPPGSAPARVGAGTVGSGGVWVRRVLQMPIAERWLVLSVAAVAGSPAAGVGAYLAQAVLAELWVTLGSVRRTRGGVASPSAGTRAWLAWLRDDGFVALGAPGGVAGWALAPLLTIAEGVLLCLAVQHWAPHWSGAAFGWFALVAWHRYDLGLRRASRTPRIVNALGLGWPGRSAVVLVAGACGVLPAALVAGIAWLAVVYVPESLRAGARIRIRSGVPA
ncbi:CDP-alcohol phosphatidyltransferase family protein [Jatrophihabitans sp.]|uniref:CDP-alcohol phosphatidyltransferase family protein n=1 Tax=Jatrophihabitans sp. TaxID=1932789 RepID=UPI0030C660AC|nr:phospho-di-inositol-phosphate synthase [Jatrophihabitans sp.]